DPQQPRQPRRKPSPGERGLYLNRRLARLRHGRLKLAKHLERVAFVLFVPEIHAQLPPWHVCQALTPARATAMPDGRKKFARGAHRLTLVNEVIDSLVAGFAINQTG